MTDSTEWIPFVPEAERLPGDEPTPVEERIVGGRLFRVTQLEPDRPALVRERDGIKPETTGNHYYGQQPILPLPADIGYHSTGRTKHRLP